MDKFLTSFSHLIIPFAISENPDPFLLGDQIKATFADKGNPLNRICTYKRKCNSKNIYIDHVNGYVEHVHCLISINQVQIIFRVALLFKRESSFLINPPQLYKEKFE